MNKSFRNAARRRQIIWAVAAKDIADALKNKTIVTMMIGLAFTLLASQGLPLLLKLTPVTRVVVYDPADSTLLERLKGQDQIRLIQASSIQEMETRVTEASEVIIGVAFPADIDERVAQGGELALEGYLVHWASPSKRQAISDILSDQLKGAMDQPAAVQIREQIIYPQPDASGRPFMVSMSLIMVIVIVGGLLVPFLMMEEKETHTIETLLVSPASYSEVVMGKSIAGAFYCFCGVAVMFAFYHSMINLWWLAILAVIGGALFSVTIGLLMGTLFENPASMNLWLGVLLVALLGPVFLADTMGPLSPSLLKSALPLIPTEAVAEMLRASFSSGVSLGMLARNIVVVAVSNALLFILVVWRIGQMDR